MSDRFCSIEFGVYIVKRDCHMKMELLKVMLVMRRFNLF